MQRADFIFYFIYLMSLAVATSALSLFLAVYYYYIFLIIIFVIVIVIYLFLYNYWTFAKGGAALPSPGAPPTVRLPRRTLDVLFVVVAVVMAAEAVLQKAVSRIAQTCCDRYTREKRPNQPKADRMFVRVREEKKRACVNGAARSEA